MFSYHKRINVVERIDHLAKNYGCSNAQLRELSEDGLILESVTLEDLENTYLFGWSPMPHMMLEAIKAKASRLNSRITAFSRALNQNLKPAGLSVAGIDIGKPKKSGAVAIQIAKMNLSDGQSISIVFHAPDSDPQKINPDDTLIAFRFLLNSRDVTHVVATSGGKDISLKQASLALSNLAEKNSAKFQAAQSDKQAKTKELEDTQAQIEKLQTETASFTQEIDQVESQLESDKKKISLLETQVQNQNDIQEELRKKLSAKQNTVKPGGDKASTDIFKSPKLLKAIKAVRADKNVGIFRSLSTIHGIDTGEIAFGYDRSAFVNSITGKVKTLAKNGYQDQVDNVLTMLNEYNKVADKPAITLRNGIWKLGTPKDLSDSDNGQDKPSNDTADSDKLHWYGLQSRPYGMGTTPSDAVVAKVIDNEEATKLFPDAGNKVRWGAVAYDKPLTDKQVYDFELKPLSDGSEIEGDDEQANDIIKEALMQWLDDKEQKDLTQDTLNTLKMGQFKHIFSKQLREQPEAKARKTDPDEYLQWKASVDLVNSEMIQAAAEELDIIAKPATKPGPGTEKEEPAVESYNSDEEVKTDVKNFASKVRDIVNDRREKGDSSVKLVFSEQEDLQRIAKKLNDTKGTSGEANIPKFDEWLKVLSSTFHDSTNVFFSNLIDAGLLSEEDEPQTKLDPVKSACNDIETQIERVLAGEAQLKDGKEWIRSWLYRDMQPLPVQLASTLRTANERPKNKKRWAEDLRSWIQESKSYDMNAPVVHAGGQEFDFNRMTYDAVDQHNIFGDTFAAVAKSNPQALVHYIKTYDLFNDEQKEKLIEAVQNQYINKPSKPESAKPAEISTQEWDDESKEQLERLKAFTNFKLEVGKQDVTFPTGKVKPFNINEPEDAMSVVDDINDYLSDDLNNKAKSDLASLAKQESETAYYQPGSATPVHIVTFDVESSHDATKVENQYGSSRVDARVSNLGQNATIYPVMRNSKYQFVAYSESKELGLFDTFQELQMLFIHHFNLSTEPVVVEAPESEQENEYIDALKSIRDEKGDLTIDQINKNQDTLEKAYAYFEEKGTFAENEGLMEAAFAAHVQHQSALQV